MKKILLTVLVLALFLSAFLSCSNESLNSSQTTTQGNLTSDESSYTSPTTSIQSTTPSNGSTLFIYSDDITEGLKNASDVKLIRCDGMGYLSRKNILAGEIASYIIDALKNISKTEKTVEKLSDEVIGPTTNRSYAPSGTLWLEVGSNIYRLDHDMSQLSYVNRHMGEGVVWI